VHGATTYSEGSKLKTGTFSIDTTKANVCMQIQTLYSSCKLLWKDYAERLAFESSQFTEERQVQQIWQQHNFGISFEEDSRSRINKDYRLRGSVRIEILWCTLYLCYVTNHAVTHVLYIPLLLFGSIHAHSQRTVSTNGC